MDKEIISRIKHIETFYEQAPPGFVKEQEEKPEDCIPDEECNKKARDFLANAPKKGLWMPLGKEVKVMQCWRCKQYGHRTGDRECPMFKSGNAATEKFHESYEDPMYHFVEKSKREENEKKKMWLQHLLDMSTTSGSGSEEETTKKKKKSKKRKCKKSEKSKKSKKSKSKLSSSDDNDSDDESERKKSSKSKKKKRHERSDSSDSSHERKSCNLDRSKDDKYGSGKRRHEKNKSAGHEGGKSNGRKSRRVEESSPSKKKHKSKH